MRRARTRLLLVAVPLIAATAAGCTGAAAPTVAPTHLAATSARSTPAPTVTATRTRTPTPTATPTPTPRPIAAVRPVRAPRRSAQEVSRVVLLTRRNEVQNIEWRDVPRGQYDLRAACTAKTVGRQLTVQVLDARPASAVDGNVDLPMASTMVPCTGRASTVGFGGFGYGGAVQLELGDLSGVTSAYAVLVAEPR